jgi:hypothetical protein
VQALKAGVEVVNRKLDSVNTKVDEALEKVGSVEADVNIMKGVTDTLSRAFGIQRQLIAGKRNPKAEVGWWNTAGGWASLVTVMGAVLIVYRACAEPIDLVLTWLHHIVLNSGGH